MRYSAIARGISAFLIAAWYSNCEDARLSLSHAVQDKERMALRARIHGCLCTDCNHKLYSVMEFALMLKHTQQMSQECSP